MITNVEELLTVRGSLLRQLRGQKIIDTWLAWFDEWNEVHTCSPVILQLETGNLELWTVYISGFSITWNALDLSQAPFSWLNQESSGTRWVNDSEPLLQKAKGKVIKNVSVLVLGDSCNGICLNLDDGFLLVQNRVDELFISDSMPKGVAQRSI